LKDELPGSVEIRRILQAQGGEQAGSDVKCGPLAIECKVGKDPPLRGALRQAVKDSKARGGIPAAVVKKDSTEPVVIMLWSDWLCLVGDASERWSR